MTGLNLAIRDTRALLLQAVGWAAILGLTWWWLNLPESSAAQLALSAAVLVAMFAVLAALTAFVFGRSLRQTLPWVATWVALTATIIAFVPARLWAAGISIALIPLLAPFFAHGRHASAIFARPPYWTELGWFFLLTVLFPALLLRWIPPFVSLDAQTVSVLLRGALAFCLIVLGWTALGKGMQAISGKRGGEPAVEPAQN